eukprot:GEMP01017815.1.p1 GENE.GEMP01017815.1~~GEMP01017815.1.p1  ORF type:complete len:664 (+),score=204.81 GEMP01017815.1:243-2234(+)
MRFLFFAASAFFLTNEVDRNRPVTKVITLLKDMQKQLEKEAEDDQEIYDHMACWCKTNDREKTDAIKEAEQTIDQLTTRIEELTARSSRLNTEVENLIEEVAKNQESLDKAIKLREKQYAEFTAEEKDMLEAIQALKSAITVLSKHHGSLIQESDLMTLAASIHRQITRFPDMISESVTPSERRALNDFMQAPGYQSYNSQSGQIFGILKNMRENFQQNLSEAQKEEQQRQSFFEELKASKEEEIAAGNAQIDKKTQQKADADNDNSEAKQQLEDTRNSLSADEQFLMNLKEKCAMTDKEWERRQKTRQEEIAAVGKALEILSKDDAHDTFTKTFNASFLQMSEVNERTKAAQILARAAKKFNNPRLSHLANKVRLDAFTRVKAAIDQMITELLKKKEDEIKLKDWCTESLHDNARITSNRSRDKSDTETVIESLKAKISALAERVDLLNSEVSEIRVQLKRAGEDRQKENSEFQQTVADQRQTQQLLQQALNVLRNVYAPKGESLAQKDEPAGPPPPAGFKEYKKSASAGGVLSFLDQIIQDAKAMEAEAIQDESDAQEAYEELVKESNRSVEEKTKGRVNAEKAKAETEQSVVESDQRLDGLNVELSQLANEKADVHKSCDFTLKNFEIRQQARDEEVDALRQAKAILSGSKFNAFLQRTD